MGKKKLHVVVDDHFRAGFSRSYNLECRCGWRSGEHYNKGSLMERFRQHQLDMIAKGEE